MGYYTDFKLDFETGLHHEPDLDDEILEKLEEISGYSWDHGDLLVEAKWYDWKDDMKTLSAKYPDILFTLKGDGEASGDIWQAYFKNGKAQVATARIEFDPFDSEKLK